MENIPFLDQSRFSTTDKICLMIHDQLIRLEEDFYNFKIDILQAKRIEKFNEIRKCVDAFENGDDEDDGKYHIEFDYDPANMMVVWDGNGSQLPISICIKSLPRERVMKIWQKLFSMEKQNAIVTLIDDWNEEGFLNDDHILYCVNHDGPNECASLQRMTTNTYTDADVKAVLNELTLCELASIDPLIRVVKRKLLNPANM